MFKTIGNWFSKLFKSDAVKALEQWLKDLFDVEAKQIFAQLLQLAITEVQVLMTNQTLSGPDKAAQARSNLINAAKNAGIMVVTSDFNLAIELAYKGLQNANAGITINGQPAPVNNQGNING